MLENDEKWKKYLRFTLVKFCMSFFSFFFFEEWMPERRRKKSAPHFIFYFLGMKDKGKTKAKNLHHIFWGTDVERKTTRICVLPFWGIKDQKKTIHTPQSNLEKKRKVRNKSEIKQNETIRNGDRKHIKPHLYTRFFISILKRVDNNDEWKHTNKYIQKEGKRKRNRRANVTRKEHAH